MTVLVTGGSGFIGSHLVRLLAAGGQTVRVLTRPTSSTVAIRGLAVERAVGDLLEPASLPGALKGVRLVYHLAGGTGSAEATPANAHRVNVEGTANLLRACREGGVQRLVHVSSIVTLGPTTPDRPRTEEDPTPLGPTSPYVESKRRGEALALAAAREGLPALVVNPSLVLGRGAARRSPRGPIAHAIEGRPRWVVPGGTSVVDVADVVLCLKAAMELGQVGQRYIVGAENISWVELYGRLDTLIGRHTRRSVFPEALLRLAARAGCRWPGLLPSPHSLHWNDVLQGRTSWYVDASLAKKTFDWTPRDLNTTLRDAVSGGL